MFSGTLFGNIAGCAYFALFLLGGIFLIARLLPVKSSYTRLWLGVTSGVALLMWLPVLFALIFGFNILSHTLALGTLVAAVILCAIFKKPVPISINKENLLSLIFIIPMCVFFAFVETNHILAPGENGGLVFGQSTYFDANIHLSFITTPVTQGTIPFTYNILPTMQVSYPFLSDTVSASVYVWGSSLRLAYILPTVAGAYCVFTGAYIFFRMWLKSFSRATLAWLLFFFNGGFGFAYFFDGLKTSSDNLTRIFTKLYETPTNLNDKMIRWVNTFCDMMIPQRATLFGWMMLFSILYLLYIAVFKGDKRFFVWAGIFAGLTPLISTHIFLSVAVISAVWMISRLYVMCKLPHRLSFLAAAAITLLAIGSFVISYIIKGDLDEAGFTALIFGGVPIICIYAYLCILALVKGNFKEIFLSWGIYLIIVAAMALPQLLCFTLKQSSGEAFLRAHFNWVNGKDEYVWFYIKNVGITALLIIPAALNASKRQKSVIAPIAVILLIAETFAFQPNTYDNNKLLYPAYALVCGVVAEYMLLLYSKIKAVRGSRIIAAVMLILCVLSGALSMGREAVADEYEIFPKEQVELAWWIENNTEADDIFLTNDRYNNTITGMTGRSIVCGSNSFFSTHGLPGFKELQKKVKAIYADASANTKLMEQLNITYIVVGNEERNSYEVDEESIAEIAEVVYENGDLRLYKIF